MWADIPEVSHHRCSGFIDSTAFFLLLSVAEERAREERAREEGKGRVRCPMLGPYRLMGPPHQLGLLHLETN